MSVTTTIERMVDLIDPSANVIFNMSAAEALERVGSGDPERVREIDGLAHVDRGIQDDLAADLAAAVERCMDVDVQVACQ